MGLPPDAVVWQCIPTPLQQHAPYTPSASVPLLMHMVSVPAQDSNATAHTVREVFSFARAGFAWRYATQTPPISARAKYQTEPNQIAMSTNNIRSIPGIAPHMFQGAGHGPEPPVASQTPGHRTCGVWNKQPVHGTPIAGSNATWYASLTIQSPRTPQKRSASGSPHMTSPGTCGVPDRGHIDLVICIGARPSKTCQDVLS